jgi:quinol monooxygenase YgiN
MGMSFSYGPPKDTQEMTALLRAAVERRVTFFDKSMPPGWESYKAALKEEIEISVRVAPGVLTLKAVFEGARPTHITILEIFADTVAYQAHLQTPYFKNLQGHDPAQGEVSRTRRDYSDRARHEGAVTTNSSDSRTGALLPRVNQVGMRRQGVRAFSCCVESRRKKRSSFHTRETEVNRCFPPACGRRLSV